MVKIAPNPTQGQFEVVMTNLNPGYYTLQLYNSVGQQIHSEELTINDNRLFIRNIDLSGNAKGVYMLRIIGDGVYIQEEVILR